MGDKWTRPSRVTMQEKSQTIAKRFRLDRLISTNEVAETWVADKIETGQRSLLKIPRSDSSLPLPIIREIVHESLAAQSFLSRSSVLRFKSRFRFRRHTVVEYDFLSEESWSRISRNRFLKNWREILKELSVAIDLMHLQGVIHCDLKIENVMLAQSCSQPRVMIIDPDFICREGFQIKFKTI